MPGCNCPLSPGVTALKKGDRNKINLEGLDPRESCEVDACFKAVEPHANRWDYYIGLGRNGALYFEVHEVSEAELVCLMAKAQWLREKIASLGWAEIGGRSLFVAPTKGITPFALYGELSRRLALKKITVIMKGDRVCDLI